VHAVVRNEPLDPEQWRRARAVLDVVLDLPPDRRAAYLADACGADPALRRLVDELLAADAAADSFLAAPVVERAAPLAAEVTEALPEAAPPTPPRVVGRYRLLSELGEGGMGSVYLARRDDGQFEHLVAIKLLKQGLHGADARRRFLQERQILARLQHPAIARLLDGGVTEDGVPFFVMERVEGRPITAYCDDRGLSIESRLRVFLQVCDAAQHAHRNLVVHRDLKPSNILVEDSGQVKLLDFGIAKLLAEGDDSAEPTRTTMRVMTPEYAAPEQLRGDPVTTATDVYALGVLLYELLAGQRPYRVARGSVAGLEPQILGREPARPSDRATSGLPGIPAREVRRRLRGDLDRIALQALQKDPELRYPSPEALATDIRRHLAGLPVAARGDALAYRARKFLGRHRLGTAAGALVVLSLLGGLAGTTWQARRADAEAKKAEAVKDFLKSLLAASDPTRAQGRERTARQLLDDGARRIETDLKDQPEVQSEVARLIAASYQGLGEYGRAATLLRADLERHRRVGGPRSVAVAESLTQLGDALYDQGQLDAAGAAYEEALGIQRAARGERTPEVAELLWDVAGVKRNRGELAAAEGLQRQALAIQIETRGEDSAEATNVRESLAITYSDGDRYREAEAMQGPVVAWREHHLGADHPHTLNARYNHAVYLLALGRLAEAARIAEDVCARQRRVLGARHDRLAASLRLLARARDGAGRTEQALAPIAEAVAIHRANLGPSDRDLAVDLAHEAVIEARAGRLTEGTDDARRAVAILEANPGIGPTQQANVRSAVGLALAEAGSLEEADRQLMQAVASFRAARRRGVWFGRTLDVLGDVARRRGQTARAAELGEEALDVLERSGGAEHPLTLLARVHAGTALWSNGAAASGESLLRTGLSGLERVHPTGHPDLAEARALLGQALARDGRSTEARPVLLGALEWRRAHFGPEDPRTVAVRRTLAAIEKP
jgi:serine/threonine-protein kinase